MPRILAFALHATAATIMAWGWFSLHHLPIHEFIGAQKGGHLQYLTIQGLAFAWLCMVASLLCDLFPTIQFSRQVKKALLMIALPLAFVVTTIYWSLLLFFPHLIVLRTDGSEPTSSGSVSNMMRIPLKTDLALHASPLTTLLIDFFVFERKFSKAQVSKAAPAAVIVFAIWYASFVEYCAPFNGAFPYPFLTFSPFEGRLAIYTVVAGLALACFRGLNTLHS